ncbi:MAG: CGNR zinc finger domain-containing protein, partial [Dehalococcoidia bacterium]
GPEPARPARVRCRGDDCHWAFFDRSKNRSRVWCDMAACGARSKARTYRERQRRA